MLFGNGFRLDDEHGMEDFHFAPQTWLDALTTSNKFQVL